MKVKSGLGLKIFLTVLLVILSFCCAMFFGFYRLSSSLYDSRSDMPKVLAATGVAVATYAQSAQQSGKWSQEEAQRRAGDIIAVITPDEYCILLLLDGDGRVMAAAGNPDYAGKPLSETNAGQMLPPFYTL